MTKERLDEIRKRADAASPGPWITTLDEARGERSKLQAQVFADLKFAGHARQDIPDLLDEVAHLQERLRLVVDACRPPLT